MKVILVLTSLALLSGCYSIGDRRITNVDLIAQIVPGTTTKVDVARLVGQPTVVDFDGQDREKWFFQYELAKLSGRSFIPIIGWFAGPDVEKHTLTVLFDDVGVVKKIGGGAARSKDTLQGAGRNPRKAAKRRWPSHRVTRMIGR